MLPFARLAVPSFADPCPPTSWTCDTPGGGTSYIYDYNGRGWYGKAKDQNAQAYLYMPVSTVRGAAYRLSFRTTDPVQYGLVNGTVYGLPGQNGLTQFDFQLGAGRSDRAFVRTSGIAAATVSGIIIEQLA